VSLLADVYARISPHLAHRPGARGATRAHAWLLRKSGGRLGRRLLGVDILVVRTTGRRSGQPRDSPAFYITHRDGFAVCPSNAASPGTPAWWLNLQADPDAEVLVRGKWSPVRARRASDQESAELWPRFVEVYRGFDHYKSIATRELPVVLLEPR
jgi:F420H(2)-dependent quinone reductase